MIQRVKISLLCLFSWATVFAQDGHPDHLAYIDKYKDLAIQEMERAGIPASIKLAQGILESAAGKSYLARKANNHFGIKCHSNWDGKKVYRKDDDYDENGKLRKSCFRGYKNAYASYIAHSEFLRDPRKHHRYGFLFELDPTDYHRWAKGLRKAGYATSSTYHKKLINLIERYELYQYDRMVSSLPLTIDDEVTDRLDRDPARTNTTSTNRVRRARSYYANDVRYATSTAGQTVADVAEANDVSVNTLLRYNEKLSNGNQTLEEGIRVYLQPKRGSFRGRKAYHKVQEGETMYDISQMYAIALRKLYQRNLMEEGDEPLAGIEIKIKGGKVRKKPALSAEKPVIEDDSELIMEEDDFEEPITNEELTDPLAGTTFPETTGEKDEAPLTEEELAEEDWDDIIMVGIEEEEVKPEKKKPGVTVTTEEPEIIFNESDFEEEPAPVVTKPEPVVKKKYHVVVQGDTLWNISQRYNLTVAQLKTLNNLSSNTIKKGMELRVQ